ncbi:MAG TPA: hypothetical protein VGG03_13325 [Thermoanaerobaculia bacterium]
MDQQFTLEYLQTAKMKGAKPSWRAAGYFGKINHAIEAWVSEAIRESEKTLPEALADVRARVEDIMSRIRGHELRIAGELV